jgi:hypothetical protein
MQPFSRREIIMQKLNCWEIMKCGRAPGGDKAEELGVCPAAIDTSSNNTNEGINGGRVCWAVAGTLSGRNVCGHYAKNKSSCMTCKVFKQIKSEEGADFSITKLTQRTGSPVLQRILLYNYARFEMQQAD